MPKTPRLVGGQRRLVHGRHTARQNFAPDKILLVTFQVVFESVMVALELHDNRLVEVWI